MQIEQLEELRQLAEKYPIGTGVNRKTGTTIEKRLYYNEQDLGYFKTIYNSVKILDDYYCEITYTKTTYEIVNGYLFDGKKWHIATETYDGWLPIELEIDNVQSKA